MKATFTAEHHMKFKLSSLKKETITTANLSKITLAREECIICFEETAEFFQLECKHYFCEFCINKIRDNNQIKCPLCRNNQENLFIEQCNLSEKDKKIILDEFSRTKEQYRIGKNYAPFGLIIAQIAKEKGIKITSQEVKNRE